MRSLLLVSLVTTLLFGCAGSGSTKTASEPAGVEESAAATTELGPRVQALFEANCTSCHSEPEPAGQLDLTTAVASGSLVDRVSARGNRRLLVAPGQPESSYLIDKLEGTHRDVGGSGARMPRGDDPLSDAEVATIRSWIASGAQR